MSQRFILLAYLIYTIALPSALTTVGTLQLIQSSDLEACIRETGIEQGAKRGMATCPEAFWPNALITFFFPFKPAHSNYGS